MKKRDLAAAVAQHVDVDPKVAARVLDGTIEVILATVAKGEDVTLTGFAKLSKVKRAARMGRNPQTGEPVKIKAKTVAKITPLKGFKDVVLGVAPAPKVAAVKKTSTAKKAAPASTKKAAAGSAASERAAAPAKKAAGTAKKATTTAAKKASAPAKKATGTAKKAAGTAKKATGAAKKA